MSLQPTRLLARFVRHLALFALMLLMVAPSAGAIWECEGRICSFAAGACCCVVPTESHDPDCGPSRSAAQAHLASTAHVQESGDCIASCHCAQTVSKTGKFFARTTFFTAAPPLVFVAVALPAALAEVPRTVAIVRPNETRGPPRSAALLDFPSLRGPPVA